MIPAPFDYHRPRDIAEALALLQRFEGDAKLLAGGHSLLPSMKLRVAQPRCLIDLAGLEDLKGVAVEGDRLRIGAMTTHWQVESSATVKASLPVLSEVASVIADPQVRNRGTMGGSVSNADPAADYPASLLALNAEIVCVGPAGERTVKAVDWFRDLFTTALEENEILREIRFPLLPARTAAAYVKLPHQASRFALVGVCAALTVDEDLRCADARIGITGAGAYAIRASAAERDLRGRTLDDAVLRSASAKADEGLSIGEDFHFSVEDRRQLCRAIVHRALQGARDRARAGQFQPDGAVGL